MSKRVSVVAAVVAVVAAGAVVGSVDIGCAADPLVLHMRSWGDVKSLYRR